MTDTQAEKAQETTEYCFKCRTPLLSGLEKYLRECNLCRGVAHAEDTA